MSDPNATPRDPKQKDFVEDQTDRDLEELNDEEEYEEEEESLDEADRLADEMHDEEQDKRQ